MRRWSRRIAIAAVALAVSAPPAPAAVLWEAGAEPRSQSWQEQHEARFDRVRGDAGRSAEGVAAFRFELRDGERQGEDPADVERAELAGPIGRDGRPLDLRAGDAVSIGWAQWFAPSFPSPDAVPDDEWCVFLQLKERDDSGSPLVSMSCAEGRQALALGEERGFARPYSEPIVRGRWQQFVLRVRLSPGGAGLLELYRDGERVARVTGQTIRPGAAVYLKSGIYRDAAIDGTAVAYADSFRIGTTTADAAPEPALWADLAAVAELLRGLL